MTDETETPYDDAKAEYRRLMDSYGDALKAKDPLAKELFARATGVWEQIRAFNREESQLDADMHLVLAISHAIQADDPVEAKRIYDAMSEKYRSTADGLEAMKPGSTKIWIQR
jgi:hypothetical protein